eukprot:scaffold49542_cov69-Phaeocystis_antarctica.AAC.1
MCARVSSGRIGIAGRTSVASCEGSSSKQRCAAFSSAGSVKVLARCHTLSALDGVRRAPIAWAHTSLSASTTRRAAASSTSQRLERLRADALKRVGCVRRIAYARLEEVQEVLRAGGERHPVRLELDALGADGEVGQPAVAPEAGERGMVRHAAAQRELGRGGGGRRGGRRGARGSGAGLGRHL